MREALEKIQLIEEYLLDQLKDTERKAFEEEMKLDKKLADEVEAQRILIERVRVIGLKKKVSLAGKRFRKPSRFSFRNNRFNSWVITAVVVTTVSIVAYQFLKDTEVDSIQVMTYINPPIPSADVPFVLDTIDADEASVINYSSGSMVLVPASAFIDGKGNPVKGKVEVSFREFMDPVDIYLSGIPMEYAMDGEEYVFESASMSEIYARQGGKELKLKPGKKLEVVQASYTTSDVFNLYQFDKKKGKWVDKGKDRPADLNELEFSGELDDIASLDATEAVKPPKPLKPKKANPVKIQFSITTEENQFTELEGFKEVSFEIDESVKPFQGGDDVILWEDVKIEAGKKRGSYLITFSKYSINKVAEYTAYPVFKGEEEYEDAMELYEEKLENYNRKYTKRKSNEQTERARLLAERRRVDSINGAIEFRNQEVLKQNMAIDSSNKANNLAWDLNVKRLAILSSRYSSKEVKERLVFDDFSADKLLAEKSFIEAQHTICKETEREVKRKADKTREVRASIYRSYAVDNFGVWNCDTPTGLPKGMLLLASYNYDGQLLRISVNLVDRNRRALFTYGGTNLTRFQYNPKSDNFLWTVHDGKLYYFNDFNSVPLENNEKEFTLDMERVDEPLDSYRDVRRILDSLQK